MKCKNEFLKDIISDLKERENVDILKKSRKIEMVSYRCMFYKICNNKYKMTPTEISKFIMDLGLKMDRSAIYTNLKNFNKYTKRNKHMHDLYLYYHPAAAKKRNRNMTVKYVYRQNLNKAQEACLGLTKSQEDEILEMIELRKKSWQWKSKDKLTVYQSY